MKLLASLIGCVCANHGMAGDPNQAMSQLSMIMQSSQLALGKAQRRQTKLVEKLRKVVEANFNNESAHVGELIGKYANELASADDVLQKALESGVAAGLAEEKVPAKVDAWADPGAEERAQLNAQLGAANRSLQHLRRAQDRAVHEAEDDASQAFEDAGMKLSMKLGDLTEDSEAASKRVSVEVDKIRASFIGSKGDLFVAHGKDQQSRLQADENNLKKAQQDSRKASEALKKGFASFLAKSTKDVEIASESVLEDLAKGEAQEVAKVLRQPKLALLNGKAGSNTLATVAGHKSKK